jgi:hypothetical protein
MSKTSLDLFNDIFDSVKVSIAFCDQWIENVGLAIYGDYSIHLPTGGALRFIDPFDCKCFIIKHSGSVTLIMDNGYYLCGYKSITNIKGFKQFDVSSTELSYLASTINDSNAVILAIAEAVTMFYIRDDLTFQSSMLNDDFEINTDARDIALNAIDKAYHQSRITFEASKNK